MSTLNESTVEDAALTWFADLGYATVGGPHIAPGEAASERHSFESVILEARLRTAVYHLNPNVPAAAREEAIRKVLRVAEGSLVATNRAFHRMLRDGVPIEHTLAPRPHMR